MVYNVDEGGLVGVTAKNEAKWQIGVRAGSYKLVSGSPKMLKRDGSVKGYSIALSIETDTMTFLDPRIH